MGHQEKWRRLTSPTTLEDYGLTMPLSELEQVPEAMTIIDSLRMANNIREASMAMVAPDIAN